MRLGCHGGAARQLCKLVATNVFICRIATQGEGRTNYNPCPLSRGKGRTATSVFDGCTCCHLYGHVALSPEIEARSCRIGPMEVREARQSQYRELTKIRQLTNKSIYIDVYVYMYIRKYIYTVEHLMLHLFARIHGRTEAGRGSRTGEEVHGLHVVNKGWAQSWPRQTNQLD